MAPQVMSSKLTPHLQIARLRRAKPEVQMRKLILTMAVKPDPDDAKVDKMIKSICRGC